MKQTILSLALFLGALAASQAALIQYDLQGSSQPGLHYLNEPAVASGGIGGEINGGTNGFGIYLNDVSLQLFVNVGWGTGNGFASDLTGNATASHIHGPVANNFGNGFTQTSGTTIGLTRASSTASGGFIATAVTLTSGQVTDLNNGKFYINVHTAANGGGEIRGFIVPIPEPSTYALVAMGCVGLIALRLRRKA
jgi:CHRD domain/PEP-CTERM motif